MLGFHYDPRVFTLNLFLPMETSLYHIIHESGEHLSPGQKKDLAIALVKALKQVHDRPREREHGFLSHQHLSSHNVMVAGYPGRELRLYLADMESE